MGELVPELQWRKAMMQWTTSYGIPAAITISGDWTHFVKHVRDRASTSDGWKERPRHGNFLMPRHRPEPLLLVGAGLHVY